MCLVRSFGRERSEGNVRDDMFDVPLMSQDRFDGERGYWLALGGLAARCRLTVLAVFLVV